MSSPRDAEAGKVDAGMKVHTEVGSVTLVAGAMTFGVLASIISIVGGVVSGTSVAVGLGSLLFVAWIVVVVKWLRR